MANKENLKPVRSKSEARERGRKGGIASGEARRQKKNLREALEILLEREWTDKKGQTATGTEAITLKLFEKAMKGDLRAYEIIRDTTGQRPTEQMYIEVEGNNELAELIESLKGGDTNESGK